MLKAGDVRIVRKFRFFVPARESETGRAIFLRRCEKVYVLKSERFGVGFSWEHIYSRWEATTKWRKAK